MQSNMLQVQGVTNAMAKTRAALQSTLLARLNDNDYEEAILGRTTTGPRM